MINEKDFTREVTRIINLIARTIEDYDTAGNIDVDINGDLNAEDQFIATTASRAKRKLQSTTQSNMRKLSFCGS